MDAVESLKKEGINVGLINKPALNVVDKDMMEEKLASSGICLVVRGAACKNSSLGSKFGNWLLETKHSQGRGSSAKFGHIETHHEGAGGLWEHAFHQGYDDSESVHGKGKSMRSESSLT